MKGILGKKIGMLQVFDNHGKAIAVTLVDIRDNNVLQVKTKSKDGYDAVQVGFESKNVNKINKPLKGLFNKAKVTARAFIKEIPGVTGYEVGQIISPTIFKEGEFVDVQSWTKGQGFSGVIKRHNQSRGPMGHGSGYHRGVGSMGSITANKIPKGKLMPGRLGNELITIQNLQVVKIDEKEGYILIKGSLPGAKNGYVVVKEAIKKPQQVNQISLSNVKDEALLKEILETAKHYRVNIDTTMTITEMKDKIAAAQKEQEAQAALENKMETEAVSNADIAPETEKEGKE